MTTIYTYIIGFALSIAFTLVAFWLVWNYIQGSELVAPTTLIATLVGLAVMQLYTQLICFLHLGAEKRPR